MNGNGGASTPVTVAAPVVVDADDAESPLTTVHSRSCDAELAVLNSVTTATGGGVTTIRPLDDEGSQAGGGWDCHAANSVRM